MTTFTITIADAGHLAGVTAARTAYNNGLSLTAASGVEGEEGYVPAQALVDHPDYISTDEAYLQFVILYAAESYAKQYNTAL